MNDKTYIVVDSRQRDMLTDSGKSVTVNRVWITTARGASGSIDVKQADWKKEKLDKILTDFAAQLDLAFTLTESE